MEKKEIKSAADHMVERVKKAKKHFIHQMIVDEGFELEKFLNKEYSVQVFELKNEKENKNFEIIIVNKEIVGALETVEIINDTVLGADLSREKHTLNREEAEKLVKEATTEQFRNRTLIKFKY